MRQSVFSKEVSVKGSHREVKADIVATMNYASKQVTGTHSGTHDDYTRNISVHKIEVFIDGKVWDYKLDLTSETQLYKESLRLIKSVQLYCQLLANSEPSKTFGEKMKDLFS